MTRLASRYHQGSDRTKRNIINFAAQKLLNRPYTFEDPFSPKEKLACLSVRLALAFNPFTPTSREKEMEQVEHHLRVCIQVSNTLDSVLTLAPAEPLLGEAARLIMTNGRSFRPVNALREEFRLPDVERGPRGEACVALMACLASDAASLKAKSRVFTVKGFLDNLFRDKQWADATPSVIHPRHKSKFNDQKLRHVLSGSKMYFSYFIKVNNHRLINKQFLWRLLARGAAIICANCQPGADLIIPYVYYDRKVNRWTVGAIILQIKNDKKYGQYPHEYLFEDMDPYKLGIYDDDDSAVDDEEDNDLTSDRDRTPPPVIRIVASLACAKKVLYNFHFGDPVNSKAQKHKGGASARKGAKAKANGPLAEQGPPKRVKPEQVAQAEAPKGISNPRDGKYTAYDFYCGGLSPTVWGQVEDADLMDWTLLLDPSGGHAKMFQGEPKDNEQALAARRTQAPGAYEDATHWTFTNPFSEEDDVPGPVRQEDDSMEIDYE